MQKLFQNAVGKHSRQQVAIALLGHGEKDKIYLDELSKYVEAAIASSAPLPFEYDDQGNANKEHLNPAFVKWCEDNGQKPADCYTTVMGFGFDVFELAEARDRRAIPLLRECLASKNHSIVSMAVKGLARLKDTDSIPLIAANVKRFQPLLAQLIAAQLADFDDPRVSSLLDRFIINKKWRQELDEAIHKRQLQPRLQ
jgi:HEAT repeat protein